MAAAIGADINYAAADNLQLTATLPLSVSHDPSESWRGGAGDIELAAKYRFLNDERSGFSAAFAPRALLPTASHIAGDKIRLLLPLWVQKEFAGGTSIFGGGAYLVDHDRRKRNFWQAAIALTQEVSKRLSIGAEVAHQGSSVRGGAAQTRAGLGATLQMSDHSALLMTGGPTWADGVTSYRWYTALQLTF